MPEKFSNPDDVSSQIRLAIEYHEKVFEKDLPAYGRQKALCALRLSLSCTKPASSGLPQMKEYF